MGLESELSLGCRKPTITQPAKCRYPPPQPRRSSRALAATQVPPGPSPAAAPQFFTQTPTPNMRLGAAVGGGESLPRAVPGAFIKLSTEGRVSQGQGSATPRYGRDPAPPCDPAPRLWQHQHPTDSLDMQAQACPELGNQNPVSTRLPAKSPRHA